MESTQQAPIIPLTEFKRTKMLTTVGPSTDSYENVLELIKSGANGLRLNFSHGDHAEHGQRIEWIRKASKEFGKPVAILQDLQGPKIRLGDFEGIINIQTGQEYRFGYKVEYVEGGVIPTQYDLATKMQRGERLYLYDGKVRMTVTSVSDGTVYARAENDGVLVKRKGINLPDTDFGGDIITEKDKADIAYGSTQDIDYVALSFVQSAEDIRNLRTMLKNLGSTAKVVAKIETSAALENIEEIVIESDAVMIARGDLAIETMHESVPVMQRQIIALGQLHNTPTIVATQMMASMTEMPEPTRAEVSDVATAVLLGADCVMLSDETASGKYPLEAVRMMKKIIRYTEHHTVEHAMYVKDRDDKTHQGAISQAAIDLAEQLKAAAIVAETKSGATAFNISARRPNRPVIAVTSNERVCNQLTLSYGVKSFLRPDDSDAAGILSNWLVENNVLSKGDVVVISSGKHPGVVGATDTIKIRVLE